MTMMSTDLLSREYMEQYHPNYSYVFKFEEQFSHRDTNKWMVDHWRQSLTVGAIYIFLIYAGRQWMSNRPKYELRGLLTLWNLGLSIFSIMGVIRTVPEFYHVLTNYGFHHSVCVPSFLFDRVAGFWVWLFVLSKLPELGDTLFIVLRKQKLIFLHWYHHTTVLMYSWFSYTEFSSPARWFVVLNYSVHSIMYSYYSLKAMRFSPPQWISMMITALQILQMMIGFLVNIYAYTMRVSSGDHKCNVTFINLASSILMYSSYFFLFAKFFREAYMSKQLKPKKLHKTENGSALSKEHTSEKIKSN